MLIERHIFGSMDGYRTLANSAGLSAADCKSLNAFSFGTPYDPALRDSFVKNPAYWSRCIGTVRRAITRVTVGGSDDAGRPTLLFITAVISATDWDNQLHGDAQPLLQLSDLWKWNESPRLAAIKESSLRPSKWTLDQPATQRLLGLLSQIELLWGRGRPITIREGNWSLSEFLAIERIIPPAARRNYSATYRSLNVSMPVTLNCLANSVAGSSQNILANLAGPVTPYTRLIANSGLLDGRVPIKEILSYDRFSMPAVESTGGIEESNSMLTSADRAFAQPTIRGSLRVCAPLILLFVVLSMAAGAAIGWAAKKSPANPWPDACLALLDVPVLPSKARIDGLNNVKTIIEGGVAVLGPGNTHDQEPGYDRRTNLAVQKLDESVKFADLTQRAVESIELMTVNEKASLDKARTAVDLVLAQNRNIGESLQARLNQVHNLVIEVESSNKEVKRLQIDSQQTKQEANELENRLKELTRMLAEEKPPTSAGITSAQIAFVEKTKATLDSLSSLDQGFTEAGRGDIVNKLTDLQHACKGMNSFVTTQFADVLVRLCSWIRTIPIQDIQTPTAPDAAQAALHKLAEECLRTAKVLKLAPSESKREAQRALDASKKALMQHIDSEAES